MRHILIEPGPDLTEEKARARAEDIKKRLDAGGDFAAIARAESTDRAWKLADLPAGVKVRSVMPDAELRKLFDKDGAYTIAFEKNDRQVSLHVNGRAVVEVELTDRQAAEAATRDVVFKLFGSAPPYRNVLVRATLTDFSCSGDSVWKK